MSTESNNAGNMVQVQTFLNGAIKSAGEYAAREGGSIAGQLKIVQGLSTVSGVALGVLGDITLDNESIPQALVSQAAAAAAAGVLIAFWVPAGATTAVFLGGVVAAGTAAIVIDNLVDMYWGLSFGEAHAATTPTAISPELGNNPIPLVKTIRWVYADPLVLDLDGDGLEISPLSQGVLFDGDGDGIKTGTAWVGADDGLLVWDRNGNGTIDSGAELFGDQTILANGQKAAHGFAALADLDTGNLVDGQLVGAGDGVFDAKDAAYSKVRVWRDLNQDGISQAAELKNLAELGIQNIKLGSAPTAISYNNATLVQSGSFTRTDDTTGQAGSFNFAQNTFVREFVPIAVSDAAKAMVNIKGSGMVRDLREAATLNPLCQDRCRLSLRAFE